MLPIFDQVIITVDVDWAPDFMIDAAATELSRYNIRSTWFVTHMSPAIECLRAKPELFELGIHPNFLVGSSHGTAPEEVLAHCRSLVPEATSMRTHGLFQSTHLLNQIVECGSIDADLSLFLPHMRHIRPVEYWHAGLPLLRIPCVWADDQEMTRPAPQWDLPSFVEMPGLKVLAFHPIHIYLNHCDMSAYNGVKARRPSLRHATPDDAYSLRRDGNGPGSFFHAALSHLARARAQSFRVRDLVDAWKSCELVKRT